MTTPAANDNPAEDKRTHILDAAEQRFRHYGYGKTTMAEIAADVDMSAANLYRFFRNKQAIAAACARRCMGSLIERLQAVVDDPAPSAADKLERYALEMLAHTRQQCEDSPHLNELVEMVASEHRELVHENNHRLGNQIMNILEYGQARGEFVFDDPETTADAILTALVKFRVPIFMGLYPRERFEVMARNVIRLLVKGLQPPRT